MPSQFLRIWLRCGRLYAIIEKKRRGNASCEPGKFLSDTVSILALGSADFGGRIDAGRAYEIMDAYTEIGGNFIDTAHVYGDFQTPKKRRKANV